MVLKTADLLYSPIKEIQERAESLGAVSLGQGVPKFLPPLGVRRAAISAIEKGLCDFYGPARGILPLREAVSDRVFSEDGVRYDPEREVIITGGALQGLFTTLATFLSRGDELVVLSPSYFPFLNIPKVLGVNPVFVSAENLFGLESYITRKTKAVLMCNPNNPTGKVYSEEEISFIADLSSKHDLYLFVDEVYRYFTYDDKEWVSLDKFEKIRDKLVRIMSFSKSYSLSGWRVGYLLASGVNSYEILKVHEMMTTASASLPAQYAALSCLKDYPRTPLEFRYILSARRKVLTEEMSDMLDAFDYKEPDGAYYAFARLRFSKNDKDFCDKLLRRAGVALIPGSVFGSEGKGFVRLSFAAKESEIREAFRRIKSHLTSYSINPWGRDRSFSSYSNDPRGRDYKIKVEEISGVTSDSRLVKPGYVFVAIKGSEYDGHDFIPEAISKGAKIVVGERPIASTPGVGTIGLGYRRVSDSREYLALLCSQFYGNPSAKLKVIGVTGTDGKTTTSHLIAAVLKKDGKKTALLSTINAPGTHTTTPSAEFLHKFLAEEVKKGTEYVVLETTSHGIAHKRVSGVKFYAAVLTNVTPEHLDFHQSFKGYMEVKSKLFSNVLISVLNKDDPSFGFFEKKASGKIVSYNGVSKYKSALIGDYNVYNVNAAAALCGALGVSEEVIQNALQEFNASELSGRFELVYDDDFRVIVDFAHTPNALSVCLDAAAKLRKSGGRLIAVFGSAGERDKFKRKKMGAVATKIADFVVLTSEDPRSEPAENIVDEIASGCFEVGAKEAQDFVRITDRRAAIEHSLKIARKGDVVIILGKGHEETMNIGGVEYPWSDREIVRDFLQKYEAI